MEINELTGVGYLNDGLMVLLAVFIIKRDRKKNSNEIVLIICVLSNESLVISAKFSTRIRSIENCYRRKIQNCSYSDVNRG